MLSTKNGINVGTEKIDCGIEIEAHLSYSGSLP